MADGAVSDGAVSDSVMSERPPADLLADLLDDLLRSDDAERGAFKRRGGTSSFFRIRRTSQSSSNDKYNRTQSTSLRSIGPPGRKLVYCSIVNGPS